jgi:Fe-S-cluster containining protein
MAKDKTIDKLDSEEETVISKEERAHLKKILEKFMELGIGAVYGDEDNEEESIEYDHGGRIGICRAICCSFIFALTKEEVKKGAIKWNPKRPYFIARDKDGYCPHLDRKTLLCEKYGDRPLRCKKYDCRKDPNVWIDWEKGIINEDTFKHLPEKD